MVLNCTQHGPSIPPSKHFSSFLPFSSGGVSRRLGSLSLNIGERGLLLYLSPVQNPGTSQIPYQYERPILAPPYPKRNYAYDMLARDRSGWARFLSHANPCVLRCD